MCHFSGAFHRFDALASDKKDETRTSWADHQRKSGLTAGSCGWHICFVHRVVAAKGLNLAFSSWLQTALTAPAYGGIWFQEVCGFFLFQHVPLWMTQVDIASVAQLCTTTLTGRMRHSPQGAFQWRQVGIAWMLCVHRCPVGTVVSTTQVARQVCSICWWCLFCLDLCQSQCKTISAILSPWIRSILNAMTIISKSSCKVPDATGASWWIQAWQSSGGTQLHSQHAA